MTGPVRAGFVIDSIEPGGGTENQLLFLLDRFDRERIAPHVACLRASPYHDTLARRMPVVALDVPVFRGGRLLAGVRRARAWARRERLEVVLTFFRDANVVGTLGGRLAGVPVVSSRRNLGYWHTRHELLLLRGLNRLARAFVANSQAALEHTAEREGVDRDRIRVIPNAVDADRFHPASAAERAAARGALAIPEDALVIGCVANLRPVKGHDTLLDAFARVRARVPAARLALVGEGPLEAPLRERAAALRVPDAVHFLGKREDVPSFWHACDAGVLASHSEGLSNALLEAMASGVPVVATSAGGNPELLDGGKMGALFPVGDTEALAAALAGLLESPERRRGPAEAARRGVLERYAPGPVLEAWQRLIEELARGR